MPVTNSFGVATSLNPPRLQAGPRVSDGTVAPSGILRRVRSSGSQSATFGLSPDMVSGYRDPSGSYGIYTTSASAMLPVWSGLIDFGAALSNSAQARYEERMANAANPPTLNATMNMAADNAKQAVSYLTARQQAMELEHNLADMERQQAEEAADYVLASLVADMASYVGPQDWGGMYAKRREILSHPMYEKSKLAKAKIAEVDDLLSNWGTEFTTRGQAISFRDASRMAGSADPAEQREAFRIFALRSDNANAFIDSLPNETVSNDPWFRESLRNFASQNPRISPDSFARFKDFEAQQYKQVMEKFGHDPMLAAAVLSSDEYKNQIAETRHAMLSGVQGGKLADWLPAVGPEDVAIKPDSFGRIKTDMTNRLRSSHAGWMLKTLNWAGDRIGELADSGKATDWNTMLRQDPALRQLAEYGVLPGEGQAQAMNDLLGIVRSKTIGGAIHGLARPAAYAGTKALTMGTRAASVAKGAATLNPIGLAISAIIEGGTEAWKDIKYSRTVDEMEGYLAHIEQGMGSILNAVSVSSDASSDEVFRSMQNLTDNLYKFNMMASDMGAPYQLNFENLFGRNQWRAIHTRLMLNGKVRQKFNNTDLGVALFPSGGPAQGGVPMPGMSAPAPSPGMRVGDMTSVFGAPSGSQLKPVGAAN